MLARVLRALTVPALVASASFAAACSSTPSTSTGSDDVVTLPHSEVKNQSIGNCWLYATGSWLEALHKGATGEELNLSESYWSYWHWYLQILWSADEGPNNSYADLKEVQTGGFFWMASHIMKNMGAMKEGDFIPEEATSGTSRRQSTALAAINRSLREGVLKDKAARANMDLLRKEMDAAWQLSPEVSARLDAAFGRSLDKTPDMSDYALHKVISPTKLEVMTVDATTHTKSKTMLSDVLPSAVDGVPDGRLAWKEVAYPADPAGRRAFLKRAQRALHDGLPPLLTFTVDFAAMRGSTFADVPASPGRQGGHMVAMSDYQIENVPGFGTLKAGVDETRREALEAALADDAKIVFLRVKNSWGPTGAGAEFSVSGHYDLYMKYLDGPIKNCLQADGSSDNQNCRDETPFTSLVFPAGY
ncbi:MAG: hypothetical protein JST00_20120 [Deltaproteobacteria bacterium]|nr:hypothetical protein [Deltaproteobacteria bacterium]